LHEKEISSWVRPSLSDPELSPEDPYSKFSRTEDVYNNTIAYYTVRVDAQQFQ